MDDNLPNMKVWLRGAHSGPWPFGTILVLRLPSVKIIENIRSIVWTFQKRGTGCYQHLPTTELDPDQETTPTRMENISSIANYRITHKKIVLKESDTKSHVKTNRVVHIGPECISPATVINTIKDSSRFFIKEPNDTPHSGSKHHSAINS